MQDREFGQQFKAALLQCAAPTTREGIEKYLGSGMVKGIGPVYAKKLVDKFGDKIFEVIEARSADLETVDGIGPHRRSSSRLPGPTRRPSATSWSFLHSQGVSTARAVRIYKTYGDDAVEKVRANPYALAKDIHGIGFKTADQIAAKIGIPHDSHTPLARGVDPRIVGGHRATAIAPCPSMSSRTRRPGSSMVDEKIVDTAFEKSLADSEVVRERLGEEDLVFLPALKRAEESIAARIKKLCAAPATLSADRLRQGRRLVPGKTGKELAPSQRQAVRQALRSRALIITGGPGVGKTTLVNAILQILCAKKVRCLLCAPTGRAAKRLSEATRPGSAHGASAAGGPARRAISAGTSSIRSTATWWSWTRCPWSMSR